MNVVFDITERDERTQGYLSLDWLLQSFENFEDFHGHWPTAVRMTPRQENQIRALLSPDSRWLPAWLASVEWQVVDKSGRVLTHA